MSEGQFAKARRLCPPFSRSMVSITVASVLFVVLYLAFLLCVFALTDLLVSKGRLEVVLSVGGQEVLSPDERARLVSLAGEPVVAASGPAAPQSDRLSAVYHGRGMLPLAWRTRDTWAGGWLADLYH